MENVINTSEAVGLDKEFIAELNKAASNLNNAFHIQKELHKNLSKADLAISDILHDIEFSKLSGPELMKDVVLLRQVLRERRKIKDCLHIAQTLQAVRDKLSSGMKNIKRENRVYNVRIMKGLKIAYQAQ